MTKTEMNVIKVDRKPRRGKKPLVDVDPIHDAMAGVEEGEALEVKGYSVTETISIMRQMRRRGYKVSRTMGSTGNEFVVLVYA